MHLTIINDSLEIIKQCMNKVSRLCVSQFDLVCADGWLVDMYQATLNVGFLVGSIAIGYLADRCVCDRLQS